MRKVGFGLLWFLALSMGTLIIAGAIVGGMAGANDPANAAAAGEAAGQAFGQKYAGVIFLSSLIISVIGAAFGWLPGTRSKRING